MRMNKHKTILVFLLLLAVGVMLSVLCSRAAPNHKRPTGRSRAQRIVCVPPSITEILFALGRGDRIVGVSDFCTFPLETHHIEKVGGFFNPNFERLISLKPDLVLTIGRSEKVSQFCRQENIAHLNLRIENIDDLRDNILLLGRKLACPEQARQLWFDIEHDLEQIKLKTAEQKKPRVFFSVYRTTGSMSGLTTIGGDTFLSELIHIAGGKNIFDDIKQFYPQISKESLLKLQPEIIIEPIPEELISDEYIEQRRSDWNVFSSLPAVKNNHIYFPSQEGLFIAGPRIGKTAQALAEILHPEVFGEP
jgi:iron complex transport system substrate-binding protein